MTDGGAVAQTFFRQIQPVAAAVPYMTVLGNHEGGTNFAGDLHHYVKRFNMPNKAKTSNVYYSFDVGPAHIVAFSRYLLPIVIYDCYIGLLINCLPQNVND